MRLQRMARPFGKVLPSVVLLPDHHSRQGQFEQILRPRRGPEIRVDQTRNELGQMEPGR